MTVRSQLVQVAVVASIAALSASGIGAQESSSVAPAMSNSLSSQSIHSAANAASKVVSLTAANAAPRREASVAGFRRQVSELPRPVPVVAAQSGKGQTLAIIGGAAFLGGLVIGDDAGTAIAVGGLIVGIYGLWLLLR